MGKRSGREGKKSEEECERRKGKGEGIGPKIEKSVGGRKRMGEQRRQRKLSDT